MNLISKSNEDISIPDLARFCRPMLENSALPFAIVEGLPPVLQYANPAFCHMLDCDGEALMGRPFIEAIPEARACLAQIRRIHEHRGAEDCLTSGINLDDAGSGAFSMWPICGESGAVQAIMIQIVGADIFRQQAAAMNESLLLAGLRQHELTEVAESQNSKMQLEIQVRERAEAALHVSVETLEERVAERTTEVQLHAVRLRALASELSRVEQRERKRLAHILHDHIQQLLVAARMQIHFIQREFHGDLPLAAITAAEEMLIEALDACHTLAYDLSPPALHELGLVAGLSWLADGMKRKHQLTVRLRLDSNAEPANEEIRILLFECVRELLFNTVKYAGTSEALVELALTKQGLIRLVVSDEGKGFDPAGLLNRKPEEVTFGLFSVQERLAHLGGEMKTVSAPGCGTRISLTVPLGVADNFVPSSALGGTAGD